MSRISLASAIDNILAAHSMPDGYTIKPDYHTDNLLVCGRYLAFAITRKAIDDGYYLTEFKSSLKALIACEESGGEKVILPPIAHPEGANTNE